MKYAYYPGCSLESTGKEFDLSCVLAAQSLGIELIHMKDWNCCGATSAHSLNRYLSIALPARNLGIASEMGLDVIAPCAACYNRMKTAECELKQNPDLLKKINDEINSRYNCDVTVKSALEVFSSDEAKKSLKSKIIQPLSGLKVACYYGCLLVRPPKIIGNTDYENPTMMDDLMSNCGAEPIEWYFKTECCGASMGISYTDVVVKLVGNIISNAKKNGADCIVTACPLCMTNLEIRQEAASKLRGENLTMPIFYFTELMGIAMESAGVKKCLASHLVDTNKVLDIIYK